VVNLFCSQQRYYRVILCQISQILGVPRLCFSYFAHIYTKYRPTNVRSTIFVNISGLTAQKPFEKWLLLWTKVGENVEENLWFLLLDQSINLHISIIFLDGALKFDVVNIWNFSKFTKIYSYSMAYHKVFCSMCCH